MSIKLMLVTSDIENIKEAQKAGIDRIFFDLEYINKRERQHGRNTLILHNDIEELPAIRKACTKSELVVRVNALYPHSKQEIDKAIEYGADIIMLPMVMDAEDVRILVDYVGGRAKVMPMVETAQALARIDDILEVKGIDEIYIGLNDLHISMGLAFMFELLSGGLVEYATQKIKKAGVKFGFGGMAKIGEGSLPAEAILAEHYRLDSNSVILSRTFRNEVGDNKDRVDLVAEVQKIRNKEREIENWTNAEFENNRILVKEKVRLVTEIMNGRKL